jgi:hypothetical protein
MEWFKVKALSSSPSTIKKKKKKNGHHNCTYSQDYYETGLLSRAHNSRSHVSLCQINEIYSKLLLRTERYLM